MKKNFKYNKNEKKNVISSEERKNIVAFALQGLLGVAGIATSIAISATAGAIFSLGLWGSVGLTTLSITRIIKSLKYNGKNKENNRRKTK